MTRKLCRYPLSLYNMVKLTLEFSVIPHELHKRGESYSMQSEFACEIITNIACLCRLYPTSLITLLRIHNKPHSPHYYFSVSDDNDICI